MTHSGVPSQTHTPGNRCHRTAVSKKCLQLSQSQKRGKFPRENHRHGYRQTMNQRSKKLSNGLRKQVFRQAYLMDARILQSDHTRRPDVELRTDASKI